MKWTCDRIISHRGASAYAPENTMAAFEKAYALGSRYVEFDVMLSADGEAFVFHDTHLSRTTDGHGEFGLSSSSYIKSLDAGSWFSEEFHGAHIPTFREVTQWLIERDVQANIEIKPYPGCEEKTTRCVLNILEDIWPASRSYPLLSSFDLAVMKLCYRLAPHLPRGLLFHRWRSDILHIASDLSCFSIHLNRRITTLARVAHIKEKDYPVCVYTVDNSADAACFFEWGVDAIFSNDPSLFMLYSA